MNAQEKRIAKAILQSHRRIAKAQPYWFAGDPALEHVQVRLNGDGTYNYVAGPEKHTNLGGVRRARVVWAVRYGCRVKENAPGIAYRGFGWKLTRAEALEALRK